MYSVPGHSVTVFPLPSLVLVYEPRRGEDDIIAPRSNVYSCRLRPSLTGCREEVTAVLPLAPRKPKLAFPSLPRLASSLKPRAVIVHKHL